MMRLIKAQVVDILIDDAMEKRLQIVIDDEGTQHELGVSLPDGWATWDRAERVQWVRDWITAHAQTHRYVPGADIVFPDAAIKEQALVDFENLPGFATWTAQDAETWIESTVMDLDSAKVALSRLSTALVFLRDIVIQRIGV